MQGTPFAISLTAHEVKAEGLCARTQPSNVVLIEA